MHTTSKKSEITFSSTSPIHLGMYNATTTPLITYLTDIEKSVGTLSLRRTKNAPSGWIYWPFTFSNNLSSAS